MLLLNLPSSQAMATLPDDQIVSLAREGNPRAAEEIIGRYKSVINGICSRFYLPGAERSDLESECLMGLWHAVQKFRLDKNCDFRLFASYCMERHAMNAIRGANRGKHGFLNEAGDLESIAEMYHETPVDYEDKRLLAMEIESMLDPSSGILNDLEAKIVRFRIDGWKTAEIAEVVGQTPKNVGRIWHRVRLRIRTTLASAAPECLVAPRQRPMKQALLLTVPMPATVSPRPRRIRRQKSASKTNAHQLSLF